MALTRNLASGDDKKRLRPLDLAASGGVGETKATGLPRFAPDPVQGARPHGEWVMLAQQFISPSVLILLITAGIAFLLGEQVEAALLFALVGAGGLWGWGRQCVAFRNGQKLRSIVQAHAIVLRGQKETRVPVTQIVPGDTVLLRAGDIVPADALVVEADSLFVDESMLTGEARPQRKTVAAAGAETGAQTLYQGSQVVCGRAWAVVVAAAKEAKAGRAQPLKTEFEQSLDKFARPFWIMSVALLSFSFVLNLFFQKPALETALFTLALASGIAPRVLLAAVDANLARGAKALAAKRVIVKRPAAVAGLSAMNVLCCGESGIFCDERLLFKESTGPLGGPCAKAFLYAYLSAVLSSGVTNPADEAIKSYDEPDISDFYKLDEKPYDCARKLASVLVAEKESKKHLLISKGALEKVLAACDRLELADGSVAPLCGYEEKIRDFYRQREGGCIKTLAIACRDLDHKTCFDGSDERGMVFLGFVSLLALTKADAGKAARDLKRLGVALKVVTEESRSYSESVLSKAGFKNIGVTTGEELEAITNEMALIGRVKRTILFAELLPGQKETVIAALKKSGDVVGYLAGKNSGQGGLGSADVSIAFDGPAAIRCVADAVLLDRDLMALKLAVLAGRGSFTNAIRCLLGAAGVTIGFLFGVAACALFLPFLPLLPQQALLLFLLLSLPTTAFFADRVEQEDTLKPKRWNANEARRQTLVFGLLFVTFNLMTCVALAQFEGAAKELFRTGWFTETVISASLVMLAIRTGKTLSKSGPPAALLLRVFGMVAAAVALPYLPFAAFMGFSPLSSDVLVLLAAIAVLNLLAAEAAKKTLYYRRAPRSGLRFGHAKTAKKFFNRRPHDGDRSVRLALPMSLTRPKQNNQQVKKANRLQPQRPKPGTLPEKDPAK